MHSVKSLRIIENPQIEKLNVGRSCHPSVSRLEMQALGQHPVHSLQRPDDVELATSGQVAFYLEVPQLSRWAGVGGQGSEIPKRSPGKNKWHRWPAPMTIAIQIGRAHV